LERIDYLSKIDRKDAKTGILIQAELRVTMEFINIISKNPPTGLFNAFFLCLYNFHVTSYSCHETGSARHM